MARFEVELTELGPEDLTGDPRQDGLLLADVLQETDGKYMWHFVPDQRMRDDWAETARVLGEESFGRIANAPHIPVSLKHLKDRDPATTRIRVRFMTHFDSPEEAEKLGMVDDGRPLK